MSRSGKRDARVRVSTRVRLVQALRQADAPLGMIAAAERGVYDSVYSTLMDPLTALIYDARKEGLEQIALRAEAGEWREQAWERQEWLEDSGVAEQVRAWNTLVATMRAQQAREREG